MPEKEEDLNRRAAKEESVDSGNKPKSIIGLVRGIGNLIDLVASLEDEKSEREGEITDPSGRLKAGFKFSIKTGLSEPLEFDSSGERREPREKRGPSRESIVEEEIQPIVDVFDEESHVLVIIELPGVEEEDIHIEVNGDILLLSAANRNRNYSGEVVLPGDVDGSTVTSKYKNGVLEIRMSKRSHDEHDHSNESRGSKSS
ncbi:MAG TPA: Hsp20/alpha crystallin family protein [Ktedonobacteraceae bacterium]|nr:Hsp20/alpha crystallin family protein [Ktedonobacteraceae bacterium]